VTTLFVGVTSMAPSAASAIPRLLPPRAAPREPRPPLKEGHPPRAASRPAIWSSRVEGRTGSCAGDAKSGPPRARAAREVLLGPSARRRRARHARGRCRRCRCRERSAYFVLAVALGELDRDRWRCSRTMVGARRGSAATRARAAQARRATYTTTTRGARGSLAAERANFAPTTAAYCIRARYCARARRAARVDARARALRGRGRCGCAAARPSRTRWCRQPTARNLRRTPARR